MLKISIVARRNDHIMPEISVIISMYNSEKHLERCLSSLILQTFEDIEIILVDDGSTDQSVALAREMAKRDKRISLIEIPQNGGQANARNIGISAAKGKYICFCDSDDFIDCEAMKSMHSAAAEGADVVMCGYFIDIETKNGTKSTAVSIGSRRITCEKEMLETFIEIKNNYILDAAWNKLYKTSFLKDNGIVMPAGEIFEDTEFALLVLMHTNNVVIVEDCFYHYIQHFGSTTRKFNPQKLEFLRRRTESMKNYFVKIGAGQDFFAYAHQFYLMSAFSYFSDLFLDNRFSSNKSKVIREEIKSEYFKNSVKLARASGFSRKLTLFVAKKASTVVCKIYAYIIYLIKYKMQGFFIKIR